MYDECIAYLQKTIKLNEAVSTIGYSLNYTFTAVSVSISTKHRLSSSIMVLCDRY